MIETDAGQLLVKLRGAAQGPGSLVAEVIVGELADHLGLAVPARRVVTLATGTPTEDRNDELADLLAASVGENLGFQFLERTRAFEPADVARVSPEWASQVRWLDWLVLNPDRTPANPNILVQGSRFWLIDHGAALSFQHDWKAVTEQMPTRVEHALPHLFDGVATELRDWDPVLTSLLTRDRLTSAVASVPESFLLPLLEPAASGERLSRRREAYVAFLWKRLQGERIFREPGAAFAG